MERLEVKASILKTLWRVTAGVLSRPGLMPNTLPALAVCVLLALSLFLSGCAAPGTAVRDDERGDKMPLIWPSPPEPARISYVTAIYRPSDIGAGKGFFKKVVEFLLGESRDDIIKPYGVVSDSAGRLIVADTAFKRVHVFDMKKNKYVIIDSTSEGALESPISAAVDAEDNIYVTDSLKKKVYVFGKSGRYLRGFDAGERPTGISVNETLKQVYVSDTASHRITVFDLNGKKLFSFGGNGGEDGELNFPVDLFIDKDGDVYVADTMNYRIQVFDKTGKFRSKFGRHGDGTGDFGRPKGVAVDRDGNVYVADALFDTVQIFDKKGDFLLNFGSLGSKKGSFWMPGGVFIDRMDKIYVADSYNGRVQVFEYIGNNF